MKLFDTLAEMGHEEIVMCSDPSVGYKGILAVHSTKLGPALGGTRYWQYATDDEAITDALRLSRGMTYKNAVAGLHLGGGKSIIIGDNKTKDREKIFRAHGRFVESLGGRYITAEDVGTSTKDMAYVQMETKHVAGLAGKSGDPSPVTAHGVFRAVQASANRKWGSDSLEGKTIAVQGCGSVGSYLAGELHEAGAKLIVSDIDAAKVARVSKATGAKIVEGDAIFSVDADIFSPCALGGIINDKTIPKLKVQIVAGGANNQLLEERHGDELERRGILYAPDYVANAGGVINVFGEVAGWDAQRALDEADNIYDTILKVFDIAEAKHIPTYEAADRLAELRLAEAK
ncbi:MAG TPA: Glu/Leu/Phe/Val dehydrogenase [Gemmatimonadaceae bacterium]|jgi:leucine dehydrogenase|nr:Glu/Leu/Phe/Val dehydrogenase [Gemmatimonadaceae bacterium]